MLLQVSKKEFILYFLNLDCEYLVQ